ncbi:MAG: acyl-CoA dehydrogenase family protein, partial [Pseudomonadota bacterium]
MQNVLDLPPPAWREDEEIKIFNEAVGQFFEKELKPDVESWREAGQVPREVWYKAAEQGLLLVSAPEEYGGAGGDFRHDAVIIEQLEQQGIAGFGIGLHNAIVAPYIIHYGSEDQKKRLLPKLASGDLVCTIAMTEPGTGSDLQN